jgi:8-oxo-dGTP pyrophosphatase MutT (NUDIX family)
MLPLVVTCSSRESGQNDGVHNEPTKTQDAQTAQTAQTTQPPQDDAPEIRTLTSSVVYADDWIRLRKDEIERLDGGRGTYAFLDKRDFALIIAAENGGFHLVEEYRYPLGRRGWSFPQGGFPPDESGTPEELARMELAQETGLRAATMTHLGTYASGHGMTNQYCQAFVATGLTPGPSSLEPEELGLVHKWLPRDRFEEMVSGGLIVDDSTLAAYALLLLAESRGELVLA